MAKKTGRKLIEIDAKQVEALASYGCTKTEIASFFGCNETTIRKRFSENLIKGKEGGKIRLRKKQFEVAMSGNVSMLIWLGKNILDQKDKQDFDVGDNLKNILIKRIISDKRPEG